MVTYFLVDTVRTYDDTSDTNVILDIYGGATAGKRGILSLSGRTGDNGADIGTIWFNNDNNSGASPGSTMKLVSALQVTSVTSDGNAGSDAGSIMRFYTKPEASFTLREVVRLLNTGQAQFVGGGSDFHGFAGHQFVDDRDDTMMVIENYRTISDVTGFGIHILYTAVVHQTAHPQMLSSLTTLPPIVLHSGQTEALQTFNPMMRIFVTSVKRKTS